MKNSVVFLFNFLLFSSCFVLASSEIDLTYYRNKVKDMFYHAYNGYLQHAFPLDELQPLTCSGHDTWGSFSLTLVDALDTLLIMGNVSEYGRVVQLLQKTLNFDQDINISVFETNIRIVGGLLSAHMLAHQANLPLPNGWPCSGPLLDLAETIARRLLPAFDTPTGMPYGTVNMMYGVPQGETSVTCTAGVGTYLLEFGTLTHLTGDPVFWEKALKAVRSLWKYRSEIDLVGNHIDVQSGKWTAVDSGIGAGVDSFFEYLVKGSALFQQTELISMFNTYKASIDEHLKKDDWYMWANMKKGTTTLPIFQSLEAFWPGTLSLIGELDSAMKSIHNYHQVWKQYGFTPEFYNIPQYTVHNTREGYPLRPELAESVMYLYRATGDPYLLEVAKDIVESIDRVTKTSCGYATVKSVVDHTLEDRMESFFLAETAKYLYLIFEPENFIHNNGSRGKEIQISNGYCIIDAGGYVFNSEAHPIDPAILHCCSNKVQEHLDLDYVQDNLDLLELLSLPSSPKQQHKQWRKTMQEQDRKKHEDKEVPIQKGPDSVIIDPKVLQRVAQQSKVDQQVQTTELKIAGGSKVLTIQGDFSVQNILENMKEMLGKTLEKIQPTLAKPPAAEEETSNETSDEEQVTETVFEEPEHKDNVLVPFPSRLLTCPAQPFYMKISVMGEMFPEEKTVE